MLRPAQGITNRARLVAAGSRGECLCGAEKNLFGNAAMAFHDLRRVAREMAFENLENTLGVFERRVGPERVYVLRFPAAVFSLTAARLGMSRGCRGVFFFRPPIKPGVRIVALLLPIPPREQPIEIFRILELVTDESGGVGVMNHVVTKFLVPGEHIIHQRTQEQNVATCS